MDKETRQLFLTMADLSGEEQNLARQQSLADQLRGQALKTPAGKDWGSQAATALSGVGSVLGEMKARRAQEDYMKTKQRILDRAMAIGGDGGGGIPKYPIAPPAPPIDIGVDENFFPR